MSVPDVLMPPVEIAGVHEQASAPVSPPDRFTQEETLFLVDWDDTILPTTYLATHGLREDSEVIPAHFADELGSYTEVVAETIRAMRERGRVIIVTNAETGWIDMTCAKFMPDLQHALKDVEAVSARSMFEPLGFQSPSQWKEQMFEEKIKQYFASLQGKTKIWNVLSMGDASHEREAIHKVSRTTGCLAKSLKFMERPDVLHLRQEHELIQSYLHQIVQHGEPLDLCVHEL